jgi:hypothetical protein|tara:strand:+ start:1349 stop:2158 length:810 start_codon:yes stop_codon:yes gene_type:complete
MSKGAGEARSVQNVEPWETQAPYLQSGFERAEALYNAPGPNYYPGQTYVDFSPQTTTALNLAEQRATAGSPLVRQAQSELLKQAQGQYLSPTTNPYIQNLFNQMAGDVTSGVQSQFSRAGRLGSAANQAVLADSLGDLATRVYAPNYQMERQNMQNALMTAPQMAQTDYDDITRLRQIGAEREGLQEAALADAMNRYQYQQALPYEKLRNYQAATGGSYGQTTTNMQPLQRNLAAGMLSGGLAGAEIGSMLGMTNPAFALGGGLLGMLM